MSPTSNDPGEQQPYNTSDNLAPRLSQGFVASAAPAEELRAQQEAHEAYIARIAHDLKNPLTTIMGRVELMKRLLQRVEITPADLQRHLTPLETAVQRLNALLDGLSQAHGGGAAQREQGH